MDPLLCLHKRHVPIARPEIAQQDIESVVRAMLAGWISAGPSVAQFEHDVAVAHGHLHGVACNSGTTALHLALAAGRAGRVVLMPTFTMIAVPNAAQYLGLTPRFFDCDGYGNIRLDHVLEMLTKDTEARMVVVVHTYGRTLDAERLRVIRSILDARDGTLVEDCAESHFAQFHSPGGELSLNPVGSIGHIACFSFYGNKIISCGEGGMAVTSIADLADRMRRLRAHAFTPGQHFCHSELAYGYRMTEMQGALGLSQLARAGEILAARRKQWAIYYEHLHGLSDFYHVWPLRLGDVAWVFPVVLRDVGVTAFQVRAVLAAHGIETRSFFQPMHQQKHLLPFAGPTRFPVADWLGRYGFYLPVYPGLAHEHIDLACGILKTIREQRRVV